MQAVTDNIIIYRGRYIRRWISAVYKCPCYIVTWKGGSRERQIFYGSLKQLLSQIDDTILFFGKWEFMI